MTNPATIGRYKVVRKIGEGGMGVVYEGVDERLGRKVAIKTIHPSMIAVGSMKARFDREFSMLRDLSEHPHILTLFDFVDEPPALVTEYLEGESLEDTLARRGRISVDDALELLEPVLRALDFAHSRGVQHRDLKPGNLFLSYMGNEQIPKVIDFGLARLAKPDSKLTNAGTRLGSPAYMAPELHLGEEASASSDVYALGVTIFEMLSGRLPFQEAADTGIDYQVIKAHVETPLPALSGFAPDVPVAIEEVVRKACAKDPKARFASVAELYDALYPEAAGRLKRSNPHADTLAAPLAQPRTQSGTVVDQPADMSRTIVDQPQTADRTVIQEAPAQPVAPNRISQVASDAGSGDNRKKWLVAVAALALILVAVVAVGALVGGEDDRDDDETAERDDDRDDEDNEDEPRTRPMPARWGEGVYGPGSRYAYRVTRAGGIGPRRNVPAYSYYVVYEFDDIGASANYVEGYEAHATESGGGNHGHEFTMDVGPNCIFRAGTDRYDEAEMCRPHSGELHPFEVAGETLYVFETSFGDGRVRIDPEIGLITNFLETDAGDTFEYELVGAQVGGRTIGDPHPMLHECEWDARVFEQYRPNAREWNLPLSRDEQYYGAQFRHDRGDAVMRLFGGSDNREWRANGYRFWGAKTWPDRQSGTRWIMVQLERYQGARFFFVELDNGRVVSTSQKDVYLPPRKTHRGYILSDTEGCFFELRVQDERGQNTGVPTTFGHYRPTTRNGAVRVRGAL